MILTVNKSFGDGGEVMGNPVMATAVLDRLLLHHSHVVNTRGESYRLREKKRAGLFMSPYSHQKPDNQEKISLGWVNFSLPNFAFSHVSW